MSNSKLYTCLNCECDECDKSCKSTQCKKCVHISLCSYCIGCENCICCHHCNNCYGLRGALKINDYSYQQYNEYEKLYYKLSSEIKSKLAYIAGEIIINKKDKIEHFDLGFKLTSLDHFKILPNKKNMYLCIDEVVLCMINKYNFPIHVFPKEIINNIKNKILIDSNDEIIEDKMIKDGNDDIYEKLNKILLPLIKENKLPLNIFTKEYIDSINI